MEVLEIESSRSTLRRCTGTLPVTPKEHVGKIIRACDYCHNDYTAETRYLNRNQGIYCSMTCSAKGNALKRTTTREPNLQCAWCDQPFYRTLSGQRSSRSGLFFCCREHKDIAQRIGGLEEIQPGHYRNGEKRYRALAFRSYPNECASCGYRKYPEILEVNHKDCDRSNNAVDNLEILCRNCHAEFHYLTRTGCWSSA